MAKEYIEREKIWNHLQEQKQFFIKERDGETDLEKLFLLWGADNAITIIEDWLSDIPSADVAPVRHGRWEKAVESQLDTHTGEYWEEYYYNCLECDYASEWKSPYYPNCGAKMDLEG